MLLINTSLSVMDGTHIFLIFTKKDNAKISASEEAVFFKLYNIDYNDLRFTTDCHIKVNQPLGMQASIFGVCPKP